jgi:hypothetical protein
VDRREFVKAAAFTTAGAIVGPTLAKSVGSMLGTPALAAPAGGTLMGCSAQQYAGKSREQLITYLQGLAAEPFDTVHNRFQWPTSLVNSYSRWIVETGRTPILSWFTRGNGGNIQWRSIANGAQDVRIRSEARALAAAGWPAFFCFHKEPENEPALGNAADWRDAHDRIYELFQQEGATNVAFVPVLMAPTFGGSFGGAAAWLPARYDLIGVDGYNRNVGGRWRSFDTIFKPARQVATNLSKQFYVIELGCVEGTAGRKGDWLRATAATAEAWPELRGVSYNHEAGNTNNDVGMNYRVDTSTTSIQGFRDMTGAPAFAGDAGSTTVQRAA